MVYVTNDHFLPYTAIGFDLPSYTVAETEATLQVCVNGSNLMEDTTVTVSAMSGTAMGMSF